MFNRFASTRPPAALSVLAASLVTATMPLLGGSTSARAADLPLKAPEPPPYQWGGCYVGANAGAGGTGTNFNGTVDPGTYLLVANGDSATVNSSATGGANADGFLGGGQVGCNYQINTFVLGLEGDFDYFRSNPNFSNNTNTLASGAAFTAAQSVTTNYLATARPRVGIAADRNLAYLTGGAAFTDASYSETYSDANGGAGAVSASKALVGWAAGAGWEYAWADHWTFRAEYLYASFPTISAVGIITGPGGTNTLHGSTDLVVQVLRAGVNFKF